MMKKSAKPVHNQSVFNDVSMKKNHIFFHAIIHQLESVNFVFFSSSSSTSCLFFVCYYMHYSASFFVV